MPARGVVGWTDRAHFRSKADAYRVVVRGLGLTFCAWHYGLVSCFHVEVAAVLGLETHGGR
jgi:hypothetical protein